MAIDGVTNKEELFYTVETVKTDQYYNTQNIIIA